MTTRWGLSPEGARGLRRFASLLEHDALAPTAIRDPRGILEDHLADALIALSLPVVRSARAVADLGSGAGVPGIPLALAIPAAHFRLVEASRRKAEFLRRALLECGVRNADVVGERAESWAGGAGAGCCDLVTARAVSSPEVVAEYAAPLLRPGGSLVLWRGLVPEEPEDALEAAAQALGLEVDPPVPVRPYASVRGRHLQVLRKAAATPPSFPRRPGTAQKRPLGRSDRARR